MMVLTKHLTRQFSKFPRVASRAPASLAGQAPSLFMDNFDMVASKASLRHCETTVVSHVAAHVFELLSELALEVSSLVINQPSRHAKGSNPVFEEVIRLLGTMVANVQRFSDATIREL